MNICDACHVAKATHLVSHLSGDEIQVLFFCNHHYTKHEAALIVWADAVETLDKMPEMV